jgi:hypothetical protein
MAPPKLPAAGRPSERQQERDAARERLKQSVDALTEQASIQARMQAEPLKLLGGASGVGLALGVLVGRSFKKTRKVYVDVASPRKEQAALARAQAKHTGPAASLGRTLVAGAVTLGFKVLRDKVLLPKLTELAQGLAERGSTDGAGPRPQPAPTAGHPSTGKPGTGNPDTEQARRDFRPGAMAERFRVKPAEGAAAGPPSTAGQSDGSKPDLQKH